MNNNIILTKKMNVLLKTIMPISAFFFTTLLSSRYLPKDILVGSILSFVCILYLAIKKMDFKKVNVFKLLIALYICLFTIDEWLKYCLVDRNLSLIETILRHLFNIHIGSNLVSIILGFCSIPFTVLLVYFFIDKVVPYIKKFFVSFSKIEKKYFLIFMALAIFLTMAISYFTTAFSKPTINGNTVWYDVIYTTDSGALSLHNTFLNVSYIENDIRQPLFGIFALPFAVAAQLIASVCFFLPNGYAYEIIMTIIQFILLSIITIMIGRMLNLNENKKIYLYLLFACSFPYLLFGFVIEQYVIVLFYLILAFYYHYNKPKKINYFYVSAVGTLLTSGIIFPIITKFKNIKKWVNSAFKCFLVFVLIVVVGGQLPQIFSFSKRLDFLTSTFSGNITLNDKIYQFTHFVENIFIASPGSIGKVFGNPSYQLMTFNSISIIGIVLLVACFISFILNRKNKMALISILWVCFSIILLFIIGWGTTENGLILYGLYFAWAYLVLIYLLLEKLLKKDIIFKSAIILICIVMLVININEFVQILKFAVKYYPMVIN